MGGDTGIEGEVGRFRRGRVPRAVRERQILAIAEELFAAQGFERTSMDEVAARAGVSKPVVYALFSGKDELFARCFARAGEELLAAVSSAAARADDTEDVVRRGMAAFLAFLADHRDAWAMLFSLDAGGRTAVELQAIRAQQTAWAVATLGERAARAGATPDPRRVELAAAAITSASEAVAHWRRAHPDVPVDVAADWYTRLVLPGLQEILNP